VALSERIIDLLYHGMKALDEQRGKTLLYNHYRDTETLAQAMDDTLKEVKKLKKLNDDPRPTLSLSNL